MTYPRNNSITNSAGFTLVETLLVLLLFALILAMGYQTITATANDRHQVANRVDRQQQLSATHRTLSNAIASHGTITGSHNHLDIDLTNADSSWLSGVNRITLKIDHTGRLLAFLDNSNLESILLDPAQQADFSYLEEGVRHRQWNQPSPPTGVEFNWFENGQKRRWQFTSRP